MTQSIIQWINNIAGALLTNPSYEIWTVDNNINFKNYGEFPYIKSESLFENLILFCRWTLSKSVWLLFYLADP
jgi:hypothetical protein